MSDFLGSAKGLARNPLGIIALFIALVYAMATGFLAAAIDKLTHCERLPIIWFIVLFPVLVLVVFAFLVIWHHHKLYSPSDYRDDKGFLDALEQQSSKERKERIEIEIASDEAVPTGEATSGNEDVGANRPPINLSGTVSASANVSGTLSNASVRRDFIVAENLALRKLEQEYGDHLRKHMSLKEVPSVAFDGIIKDKGLAVFVEVRFIRHNLPHTETLRSLVHRVLVAISKTTLAPGTQPQLLIVFVTTGKTSKDELERVARKRIGKVSFPVEIRMYDFDDLKKEFADESVEDA